jgi:CRISPR system Cascade subunit CasA
MALEPTSFNLTQESWIPIVTNDWQRKDISLVELFETWESLREIQADNPPTTLAIHRFLLAILHRAYQGPRNVDHWEEIQEDNGRGAIDYLQAQVDRFDLLHPEQPFMQDVSIKAEAAGEVYLAAVLHGNNTSTVFCHEHQWSNSSLPLAEAARLVLRLHMFDVGGRKRGATDSAAVIPAMDAANVLIRGQNLAETLLLNLMEYDPDRECPCPVIGEDLPTWEYPLAKPKERIPSGYINYLTYQWRRVKIFPAGERVVQIAVHPGDRFPKTVSANQYECGIAYKDTKKGWLPIRLNLQKSLWRDSAAFLQSAEGAANCPRIVGWRSELKSEELVSGMIHLQILGLTVDNAKPLGWTSEQFSAPVEYLRNQGLWQKLNLAIGIAEDHQQVFRSFRGSPYAALAESLKNGDAQALAKNLDGESRYWATLDRKFQLLIRDLPIHGAAELTKWTGLVQKAAREAFTESIESIRNYEARATALRTLEWKLADLRMEPEEKAQKKAKAAAKKKDKVAK